MTPNREALREVLGRLPVDIQIKYEKERKILEFVLNRIKDGEAIVVKTKKWAGISEACFVVSMYNGVVSIQQVKEA